MRRSRRAMWRWAAATVVLAVAIGVAPALAEPPVAALGVSPSAQDTTIRAAWRTWLGGDWRIAATVPAGVTSGCVANDPACAENLQRVGAAQTWIVVVSTASGRSSLQTIAARAYDEAGTLLATHQGQCNRCTTAQIADVVHTVLDGLQEQVTLRRTHLAVAVQEDGIQVFIDDKLFGVVRPGQPLDEEVTPGVHKIRIEGDCWTMPELAVDVPRGKRVPVVLQPTPRSPHLRVRTRPGGATVSVGGVAVGVTPDDGRPLDLECTPGDHALTITKDGWRTERRLVTLGACNTTDVDVVLWHRQARGNTPLWIGLVGGVAVAAGAALILIDRPPDNAEGNRTATYRPSKPLGLVVGGAGVATLVVATVLRLRPPPFVPAEQAHGISAAAPVATVTADGAWIGLAGSF